MAKEKQFDQDSAGAPSIDSRQSLRRRAEEIARGKAARMPENMDALSLEETRQALRELQAHQIAVEMQNEELRRTQGELEVSRARYFELYDLAPIGYFILSEQGLILEANLTAAGLLGVARDALVKQRLISLILPDDQDIHCQHLKLLFETGAPQVCEMRMLRADADPFWARVEATAAQDGESGAPVCRAVMSDITKRKQAEESIRIPAEIIDICPISIVAHDLQGNFLYANQKTFDLHGYSQDEFLACKLNEIDVPTSASLIEARIQRALEAGEAFFEVEHYRKDGTLFPLAVFVKPAEWRGKKVLISVWSDITEHKRYLENMEYFAIHDQLTGVLNRRSIEDMLKRTIARTKRGVVNFLLYMDLDNFKEVNDSVGHSAGDEVLITLVGLMKAALRTEDIVFRLGGDEFAILLEGIDSHEALTVAERLRSVVEGHRFEKEDRVFPLSLSIGIIKIDGSLTTGELLSQADTAMYQAKEQGKNRIVMA